ncbi:hypothetical protein [Sphaerisporangium dianthi]|uniref:DUF5753 domain-containing protein n=1 Tax=Sphaerisporangium dianthi TaxID=1436120 RepID=A0ABV9CA54_9ACTN
MAVSRGAARIDKHSAQLGELARHLRERGVPNLVSKRITLKVHTTPHGTRSSVNYDSPELAVWSEDGTTVAIVVVDDDQKETAFSLRPPGQAAQVLCSVNAPDEGAAIIAGMVRLDPSGTS